MAIIASENFDSYSDGNNVSGLSGGSGWTNNWSLDSAGNVNISNVQAQSGTLSMRKSVTAYKYAVRNHTTAVDLKYTFYIYRTSSTGSNVEVLAVSSTNSWRFRVVNDTTWNYDRNGSTTTGQTNWVNNQWNKVEVAVNQTGSEIKISINEAAEVTGVFSNSGNNFFQLYMIWPASDSDGAYYDTITVDDDITLDKDKVSAYRYNPQLRPFVSL